MSPTERENSTKVESEHLGDDDEDNARIFPQRLMEILSDPSNSDAIAWLPHGKAFIIVNREKFATKVLPKYFRKTKYTSFTRKLNRWNFNRVTRGPELGAYYHEFFQKGNESLCTQMYCKNDRAKFAVAKETGTKEEKPKAKASEADATKRTAQEPTPADLIQIAMAKAMMPTINPTLQARSILFGQQPRAQQADPLVQSLIDNALRAFQSPVMQQQVNTPQASLLLLQQLSALQQQQNRAPTKSVSNNYRASAA
jgi:hypothetical protein